MAAAGDASPATLPAASAGKSATFTTPLHNDFQWRNLYLRQFGSCTYAPPLPRDPSTTTAAFPKRRDVAGVLDSDGEEDASLGKAARPGGVAHEGSAFDAFGSFLGGAGGADATRGSPKPGTLPPLSDLLGSSLAGGGRAGSLAGDMLSPLEILLADGTLDPRDSVDADDVLFSGAFFDFLGLRPKRVRGGAASPVGCRATAEESFGDWSARSSQPGWPTRAYPQQANPHRIPEEIFALHKEAWTLLMDNRAMAWLEREAKEKGRMAAQVRRRLLEVVSNRSFANPGTAQLARQRRVTREACAGGTNGTAAADAGSGAGASPTPRDGVPAAARASLTGGAAFHVQGGDQATAAARRGTGVSGPADGKTGSRASAPSPQPQPQPQPDPARDAGFLQVPEVPLISEETAQQRVYEGFQPFFAVISPPGVLRRARDQFNASRRAQLRGLPGGAADVVGLPLFSQFATWREAYEHRTTWECTPFSFFLVHDASYNYAQVAALFVLLEAVAAGTHVHSPARCLASSEAVMLEDATQLLTHPRSIRRAAESQRSLCPLVAAQQVTEDVLLAFEQSSARSTLIMAMHVLGFLTDVVLDPETAARFLSPEALRRQASFSVPGMNVAPTRRGTGTAAETAGAEGGSGGDDGAEAHAHPSGASPRPPEGPDGNPSPAPEPLLPKRFCDADFQALFDLSLWFIDAATANSRVPVDPALLPARPLATAHPEQQQHQGVSPPMTPENSFSQESVFGARHGSAGSRSARRRSPQRSARRLSPRQRAVGDGAGRSVRPAGPRGGGESGGSPSLASLSGGGLSGAAASAVGAAEQHLYIPGREQLFHPVGSLVDAIILHDAQRQALLAAPERDGAARVAEEAPTTTRRRSRSNVVINAAGVSAKRRPRGRRRSSMSASTARAASREAGQATVSLSPATTLLSTPLVFVVTYIRLHGAPWLKNLFSRLFNILRRESVLLYVNRLDLEGPQRQPEPQPERPANGGGPGASPSSRQRPPSSSMTAKSRRTSALSQSVLSPHTAGASASSREVHVLAGHTRHSSLSARSAASAAAASAFPPVAAAALDEAFYARMERLEDLVCQDVLYVINEFFSALHGKRSATRLPQGITCLVTQFTATVHLHLLGNVILSPECAAEPPGAAARKVQETLARLKQKRMAGKAFRAEHVSDAAVTRLIRSIEQLRLTKFILFDCWIIPALNNAVSSGFLSEGSSMHLRWNIDAFARYLKILVNSPFLAERDGTAGPTSDGSGGPAAGASAAPSFSAQRGRRAKDAATAAAAAAAMAPPLTLSLPRYISGIYDVSSGSLVHVRAPGSGGGGAGSPRVRDESAAARGKSRTLMPDECPDTSASPELAETHEGGEADVVNGCAGTGAGSADPRPGSTDGATPAASSIYTVMDGSRWEDISSAMKGLNEALGIVGYDPEDVGDVFGDGFAGGGHSCTSRASMNGSVTGLGHSDSAMRVLDTFCRRVSAESSHNVVVSEFEVLPTMAAGCVDKIHELMTGQHALVEQAIALGTLPSTFGFSPYLACLHGVLLHPKLAARALDNVYHNANRLYHALLRPVQDESLLSLVAPLVVDQDDLPVVDANALMPLLASVRRLPSRCPPSASAAAMGGPTGGGQPSFGSLAGAAGASFLSVRSQSRSTTGPTGLAVSSLGTYPHAPAGDALGLHARWEVEARRMRQQRLFLATGGVPSTARVTTVQAALERVGPPDPLAVLRAGNERIQREARVVPTCFDPWWRAMALALCVKAMGVFEECGAAHAEAFARWFADAAGQAYRENRHQREAFVRQKGRAHEVDGSAGDADRRQRSSSGGEGRSGSGKGGAAGGAAGAARGGVPSAPRVGRREKGIASGAAPAKSKRAAPRKRAK